MYNPRILSSVQLYEYNIMYMNEWDILMSSNFFVKKTVHNSIRRKQTTREVINFIIQLNSNQRIIHGGRSSFYSRPVTTLIAALCYVWVHAPSASNGELNPTDTGWPIGGTENQTAAASLENETRN